MPHPIALLVTGRSDRRLTARLISDVHDGEADQTRRDGLAVGEGVSIEPELVSFQPGDRHVVRTPVLTGQDVHDYEAGTVILAADCVGWPVSATSQELAVRLDAHIKVLGRAASEAEAVSLVAAARNEGVPPPVTPPGLGLQIGLRGPMQIRTRLTDVGTLEYEMTAECARREPNEALVLAWLDEQGELETYVLDHRGSHMFWMTEQGSTCMDTGISDPSGPGLWLLTQGHAWSNYDGLSMEYNNGLDGELTSATFADAARHFGRDEAELQESACDAYPFIISGSLLEVVQHRAGDPASTQPDPSPAA